MPTGAPAPQYVQPPAQQQQQQAQPVNAAEPTHYQPYRPPGNDLPTPAFSPVNHNGSDANTRYAYVPPPAHQNQPAQVQSPVGTTAPSTYYQPSTAAPVSQAQPIPNQVPTYAPAPAPAPNPNPVPAYAPDPAPAPNTNPVPAYVPNPAPAPNPNPVPAYVAEPVPTSAPSQVPAYGANAVQPAQNGDPPEKHEYQRPQATYETQATVTTTKVEAAVYGQYVPSSQPSGTQAPSQTTYPPEKNEYVAPGQTPQHGYSEEKKDLVVQGYQEKHEYVAQVQPQQNGYSQGKDYVHGYQEKNEYVVQGQQPQQSIHVQEKQEYVVQGQPRQNEYPQPGHPQHANTYPQPQQYHSISQPGHPQHANTYAQPQQHHPNPQPGHPHNANAYHHPQQHHPATGHAPIHHAHLHYSSHHSAHPPQYIHPQQQQQFQQQYPPQFAPQQQQFPPIAQVQQQQQFPAPVSLGANALPHKNKDAEKSGKAKRFFGDTLVGRGVRSSVSTVTTTLKLPASLSPWGDNNPVTLPNVRYRDAALFATFHVIGGPLVDGAANVVGDVFGADTFVAEIANSGADFVTGNLIVKYGVFQIVEQAIDKGILEHMLPEVEKTMRTTSLKSMQVAIKHKLMGVDADLRFVGEYPTRSATSCDKGWFCPYLYASSRAPVIARSQDWAVAQCFNPYLAGSYSVPLLHLLLTNILIPQTHPSRHRFNPQTPFRTPLRHPPLRPQPNRPRRLLPPPRSLHGNNPLPRKHVVHITPPRLWPIILPPLQWLCRSRHARGHIIKPHSGLVSLDARSNAKNAWQWL